MIRQSARDGRLMSAGQTRPAAFINVYLIQYILYLLFVQPLQKAVFLNFCFQRYTLLKIFIYS